MQIDRSMKDADLQYRCLISKMSFDGDENLQTAEQLMQVAKRSKSVAQQCEAKVHLARAKLHLHDLDGAMSILLALNIDGMKHLSIDDQHDVRRLLVFCKSCHYLCSPCF